MSAENGSIKSQEIDEELRVPVPDESAVPDVGPRVRTGPLAATGRLIARPALHLVVAVLLAAALVALLVANHRRSGEDAARVEAPQVVAAHLTKLLSYTPATVSSDLAVESKWLAGGFLTQYTALITKTVAPAAVKEKVTTVATVVASGVQSASADRVEMLMFVDVATTRAGSTTPVNQGSRVRIVAQKVNGAWLISSLSPV